MALKVNLKAGERLIIGDCLITNTDQRTQLLIDGKSPILRGKDILTPETADTPTKRIYLSVQLMYLSKDVSDHHDTYFQLVRDVVHAAPSTWPYIEEINNHILTGELYKALKQAKKLIIYEQELLDNASRRKRLPVRSEGDRKPA
jgi:flagellar biosynthesis repressor protein FlbT